MGAVRVRGQGGWGPQRVGQAGSWTLGLPLAAWRGGGGDWGCPKARAPASKLLCVPSEDATRHPCLHGYQLLISYYAQACDIILFTPHTTLWRRDFVRVQLRTWLREVESRV